MDGLLETGLGYLEQGRALALEWLLSPAAWSQFALLVVAYLAALVITRWLRPRLARLLAPESADESPLAKVRRFVLMFLPLMLPLMAFGLTFVGEQVTRSLFGSGAVIAFGKRLFLFLAVRAFVRDMLHDPLLKLIGRFVLLPVAALYALGLIGTVGLWLDETVVPLGNLSFSLLWLLQFIVVGGVIFWLGRWSNDQSAQLIESQETMRPATRQLAVKAAEIAIFGAAFLVLMNIMGISLTSLAVIGGAIGVGLGRYGLV